MARTIGTDRNDDKPTIDKYINIGFRRADDSVLHFKDPVYRGSIAIKLTASHAEHKALLDVLNSDPDALNRFKDRLVLDMRDGTPDVSKADQIAL